MSDDKIRVLFICTHNQARSQMAEGILRALGKGRYEVFSAGTEPATQVHPMAVQAVREVGIDITQQHTKGLDQFLNQYFDYIITTCDKAKDNCPSFPGDPHHIHWGIVDPASFEGTPEEQQEGFRRIAMELLHRIRVLMQLPSPIKAKA